MDSKIIYGTVAVVIIATVLVVAFSYDWSHEDDIEEVEPVEITYSVDVVEGLDDFCEARVDFTSPVDGWFVIWIDDQIYWYGYDQTRFYFDAGHYHKSLNIWFHNNEDFDLAKNTLRLQFSENINAKHV